MDTISQNYPRQPSSKDGWPLEVRAVLQALARPAPSGKERRTRSRAESRMEAKLWLNQSNGTAPVVVYLRDYDERAVSFITEAMLKSGQIVELEMTMADGKARRVPCQVGRCRQFREGWFEGVLQVAR
jgi:hypothetical protein